MSNLEFSKLYNEPEAFYFFCKKKYIFDSNHHTCSFQACGYVVSVGNVIFELIRAYNDIFEDGKSRFLIFIL